MKRALVAAAVCLVPHLAAASPQVEAIGALYRQVRALQLSGLPNSEQAATLSPYLSARLRAAIARAQAEQARCREQNPGDVPPWVDGDLFTSNAEGFTAFEAGPSDARGRWAVRFTYQEKEHRFNWQDAVTLRKERGRWVVDDVHFRASAAYTSGYGSSLRTSLSAAGCGRLKAGSAQPH